MAGIVNLKRARKRKARAASEKQAEENRAKYGQTKAERDKETVRKALETSRLEGHKRED